MSPILTCHILSILVDIICGNITATISDHLPQFFVSPNTFANPPSNKFNVWKRVWLKYDQENFILDYFDIDWSNLLNMNQKNGELTINDFLNAMNSFLKKYAPFKKLTNINSNLKQNLGLLLAYKNPPLLKTNY